MTKILNDIRVKVPDIGSSIFSLNYKFAPVYIAWYKAMEELKVPQDKFVRTKTLGDGDDCCNCQYYLKGNCEWAPEKGFEHRK